MTPARPRHRPDFPTRLKAARELRAVSQAELADKAGFQPSAISRFEGGLVKPSFDNLKRLAGALRVTTDYLLGLSNEPTKGAPEASDPLYRQLEELTDEQREFAKKFLADLTKLGKK